MPCTQPPFPTRCNMVGLCVDLMALFCAPSYPACAGATCGTPCTLCDPADPGCMEPPGLKACDFLGLCAPLPVACP